MKKMELSFSCDQKWDEMKNSSSIHKHCTLCNKTIIDFESMSDDEVINYIQNFSSTNPCGKITANKLVSINKKLADDAIMEKSQKNSLSKFKPQYFIFPAFAAFIFYGNGINAQVRAFKCAEVKESKDQSKYKTSTIPKFKFEGQVKDEYKNKIFSASIVLMEEDQQIMKTESDINGKFNFLFEWKKDSKYKIVVAYIGYEDLHYPISKSNSKATLIMEEYVLMGDIIIKNTIPPQNDIPEYNTWHNILGNWFKKW